MQQQIDHNFAEISQAKYVYQQEVDFLLKSTSYLDYTSRVLKREMADAKIVYEDEVDYLLELSKRLHDSTDELGEEMLDTQEAVERVEMYGRRNIIEIDGFDERRGEDTNKIALQLFRDLGLKNVSFKDICRSHRTSR